MEKQHSKPWSRAGCCVSIVTHCTPFFTLLGSICTLVVCLSLSASALCVAQQQVTQVLKFSWIELIETCTAVQCGHIRAGFLHPLNFISTARLTDFELVEVLKYHPTRTHVTDVRLNQSERPTASDTRRSQCNYEAVVRGRQVESECKSG